MKYEAHSLGEMLRKVAIDYVRYGYYRYLIAEIPRTKNVNNVDQTLLKTYGITYCRTRRARERAKNKSVVVYVRFGHRFILLATEGTHTEIEKRNFRDCRLQPIQLSGYTVGIQNKKPNVQISLKRYRAVRKLLTRIALHNEAKLTDFFNRLSPFSFPGILRQKYTLLKMVNTKRKKAGLASLSFFDHLENVPISKT
jgi:hypothetical protein